MLVCSVEQRLMSLLLVFELNDICLILFSQIQSEVNLLTQCILCYFSYFLSSADFFSNHIFTKKYFRNKSECQTVWIQIRPNIFSSMILVKTVSKGNQQRTFFFFCFTSQVNSYGHCGTVSSPNHTFSWAGLNKRITSNSCTYFRL